jgi:hypothetical protein
VRFYLDDFAQWLYVLFKEIRSSGTKIYKYCDGLELGLESKLLGYYRNH